MLRFRKFGLHRIFVRPFIATPLLVVPLMFFSWPGNAQVITNDGPLSEAHSQLSQAKADFPREARELLIKGRACVSSFRPDSMKTHAENFDRTIDTLRAHVWAAMLAVQDAPTAAHLQAADIEEGARRAILDTLGEYRKKLRGHEQIVCGDRDALLHAHRKFQIDFGLERYRSPGRLKSMIRNCSAGSSYQALIQQNSIREFRTKTGEEYDFSRRLQHEFGKRPRDHTYGQEELDSEGKPYNRAYSAVVGACQYLEAMDQKILMFQSKIAAGRRGK